ncbi:MAG: glycosyltransferase family 2 protein [Verrucomicrobium sp.]
MMTPFPTTDRTPLPGVTIVVPVYNYEKFVAQALHSALAQTYTGEVEVLVVDDGSTDGTPGVVAGFGNQVRYYRKVNGGLSAARNTGMELARHDWVVFLDADDELEPHAVKELVRVHQSQSTPPVVVASLGRMIDGEGRWISLRPAQSSGEVQIFSAHDFVLRNRFAPIVLARRSVLLALGGFDPALKASEDRDMWIRAATAGPVAMLKSALHRKRDHGTNMSRHAVRQTQSIFQVLEKAGANPAVGLTSALRREAEAICLYQSARMHLAAGDRLEAMRQCCRSVIRRFWVRHAVQAGYPRGFRFRFLALGLAGFLRGSPKLTASGAVAPSSPLDQRPVDYTTPS